MSEAKYGDLVRTLEFQKGPGDTNAREMVYVTGDKLAGFDLNFITGVYEQIGNWGPKRKVQG
jgi:hypothetical protein